MWRRRFGIDLPSDSQPLARLMQLIHFQVHVRSFFQSQLLVDAELTSH